MCNKRNNLSTCDAVSSLSSDDDSSCFLCLSLRPQPMSAPLTKTSSSVLPFSNCFMMSLALTSLSQNHIHIRFTTWNFTKCYGWLLDQCSSVIGELPSAACNDANPNDWPATFSQIQHTISGDLVKSRTEECTSMSTAHFCALTNCRPETVSDVISYAIGMKTCVILGQTVLEIYDCITLWRTNDFMREGGRGAQSQVFSVHIVL